MLESSFSGSQLEEPDIAKIWLLLVFLHKIWTSIKQKALQKQRYACKNIYYKWLVYMFLHTLI